MSVEVITLLAAAGVLVGFSSALFGVGGGTLMVPLLVLAFGTSQHLAEGTSLLVIVPTAIAGVVAQRKTGLISFSHAGLLALGGLGGAYLGAALALQLPHEVLQDIFGVLLLVTGIRLFRTGALGHVHRRRLGPNPTIERTVEPKPIAHPEPTGIE